MHVRDERRQQVDALDPAGILATLEQTARDHGLDLRQPGLLADRRRPRTAQLDAVVLGRVVARGDHRRGRVEVPEAK